MTGTIGEPESAVPALREVSHVVTDLRMEGDTLVGTIQILDTPRGHTLTELIEAGESVVFRSCGYGNVDENGVVSDFTLTSVAARLEFE